MSNRSDVLAAFDAAARWEMSPIYGRTRCVWRAVEHFVNTDPFMSIILLTTHWSTSVKATAIGYAICYTARRV